MKRVLRMTSTVLVAVSTAPFSIAATQKPPSYNRPALSETMDAESFRKLSTGTDANEPETLQFVSVSPATFYALANHRLVKVSDTKEFQLKARPAVQTKSKKKPKQTVQSVKPQSRVTPKVVSMDSRRTAGTASRKATPNNPVSRSADLNTVARLSAKSASRRGLAIAKYALGFVGTPYRWGGDSPAGFDCSGLAQYVYQHFGIDIPRTSYQQYTVGRSETKSTLTPGDLVFFSTDTAGASHVAIYVGNDLIVQALNQRTGVIVSHFSDAYYQQRFIGARRPF